MSDDIQYSRVIMHVPSHKTRKMKNAVPMITHWINDTREPFYISLSSYLEYETSKGIHRVYNPLSLKFDVMQLVRYLVHMHYYAFHEDADNFYVVSSHGKSRELIFKK